MRSVLVMIVFVTMHVLVLAQADDSSLITPSPSPSPSTFSIQQDAGGCDTLCEFRCFFKRGIPPLYQFCMQLCKLTCPISGGGGDAGSGGGSSGGGSSGGDGSGGGSSGGGSSGGDGSGGGSSGQPAPTPPAPSLSSSVIHHCTSACVDSISTKLSSDAEKVEGDYVKTCYNNCKKKY